jgi:hypothetical protein
MKDLKRTTMTLTPDEARAIHFALYYTYGQHSQASTKLAQGLKFDLAKLAGRINDACEFGGGMEPGDEPGSANV